MLCMGYQFKMFSVCMWQTIIYVPLLLYSHTTLKLLCNKIWLWSLLDWVLDYSLLYVESPCKSKQWKQSYSFYFNTNHQKIFLDCWGLPILLYHCNYSFTQSLVSQQENPNICRFILIPDHLLWPTLLFLMQNTHRPFLWWFYYCQWNNRSRQHPLLLQS